MEAAHLLEDNERRLILEVVSQLNDEDANETVKVFDHLRESAMRQTLAMLRHHYAAIYSMLPASKETLLRPRGRDDHTLLYNQ